jgi:membrane protein implicated in regulation of membrane protease activity
MSWLTDHPALVWLALALLLAAAEVATVDFFFLMLVGGALLGAVAAAVGLPFALQVVVAVAVTLVLLLVVRPAAVRRVRAGSTTLTGAAALVGREARVLETVTEEGGRIRLGGEVWSARADEGWQYLAGSQALLPGRTVRVLAIEGATAVVEAAGPEPEIP